MLSVHPNGSITFSSLKESQKKTTRAQTLYYAFFLTMPTLRQATLALLKHALSSSRATGHPYFLPELGGAFSTLNASPHHGLHPGPVGWGEEPWRL